MTECLSPTSPHGVLLLGGGGVCASIDLFDRGAKSSSRRAASFGPSEAGY